MQTTPTTRRQGINPDFSTISPTAFSRSPSTPTTASPKVQQIQTRLTAIIRRLVENYSTWKLGHEKGSRICNQLENLKLKLLDNSAKDEDASVFSDDLTTWHSKLQVVMEVFVDIVKNASESVNQLRALEQLQQREDKDAMIVSRTWPIRRFVAIVEKMAKHFQDELQVKETVFREICHRTDPNHVTLTACTWYYPRYVSRETHFLIKCLTTECGLPDVEMSPNKER